MKRLGLAISIITLVLTGGPAVLAPTAASPVASAQDRPSANEVAASVDAFYRARRTIRARFRQDFWSHAYRRTQSSAGRIAIQRPGRVRFDYDRPDGQVFVSDGDSWTMFQAVEGTAGQYSRGTTGDPITSGLAILSGTIDLDAYRASLRAPRADDPPGTAALVLIPIRPSPHYRSIVLYVERAPDSRGMVRHVSIEDPEGNWNRFHFEALELDRDVDASTFAFAPPAGARELGRRR